MRPIRPLGHRARRRSTMRNLRISSRTRLYRRVSPPAGFGCVTVLGTRRTRERIPWGKPWDRHYTSPGPLTCARFEGSYRREEQDAHAFADWGFDFLKYDLCSYRGID